jgi:REP element-mobilizing transposase RayT
VTARGNHRQPIFRDDRDRRHFLEWLGELGPRFGFLVVAYVLMPNHYHLMVRTPEGRLSQALHWLNVSYSVWCNRRHGQVGHMFQGRFKAVLVDGQGDWAVSLSVYVHLNPVRVQALGLGKRERSAERLGLAGPPTAQAVRERLTRLRAYRWSSYRAYAGYEPGPHWLEAQSLLGRVAPQRPAAQQGYRNLVEGQLRQGVTESPWSRLRAQVVLGSEAFWRSLVADPRSGDEVGARAWTRRMGFEEVVAVVEAVKGEKWEAFQDRHGDWGRDLARAVAWRGCALTLAELGRRAGGLS